MGSAERRTLARSRITALAGELPTSPAGGEEGARLFDALRGLPAYEEARPLTRRLTRSDSHEWSPPDLAALSELLAAQESALESVRRAAGAEPGGLGIPLYEPGRESPGLMAVIQGVRLLALDGRLALAHGDSDRASRDALAVVRVLRAVYGEPSLISQLVGGGAERVALPFVREALASGDAGTLAVFHDGLARLDRIPARGWAAGEALFFERSVALPESDAPDKEEAAAERAWNDAVVARILERYADIAAPATVSEFRAVRDRLGAESAENERCFPRGWPKGILSSAARTERRVRRIADVPLNELAAVIERSFSMRTARRLAVLALSLEARGRQEGALPPEIESDRGAFRNVYTEERPLYERRADGSARLVLPEALARWRQDYSSQAMPLVFEWVIPPPRPPTR